MCAAVALIVVHAIAVLIEGGVLHHEVDALGNPISSKLYFYGITQLLLGVLAMRFTVSALRRENEVEIIWAVLLVGLTSVFDVSILVGAYLDAGVIDTRSDADGGDGDGDDAGRSYESTPVVFEIPLRLSFVIALTCIAAMITLHGGRARVDFGWRIFKLCGTSTELKRLYTFLFELNAWYQLDACLTMQQVTALSFYFFYRLALPHEIVLAVLGILATCSWIVGAALAIEREWTSWWYRAGLVGLIQPAFLVFLTSRVFVHEQCRRDGKVSMQPQPPTSGSHPSHPHPHPHPPPHPHPISGLERRARLGQLRVDLSARAARAAVRVRSARHLRATSPQSPTTSRDLPRPQVRGRVGAARDRVRSLVGARAHLPDVDAPPRRSHRLRHGREAAAAR